MSSRQSSSGLSWGQRGRRLFGSVGLGSAVLAVALTGCGKAEQEQKLAEMQKAADTRVAKAEEDARAKIAALQQQVEAIKAEAADASAQAKAMAEEAISKAQSSADDAAKEAQAALAKAREAYKADARTHLTELNKEFTEVAVQASKIPAKERAAYDKAAKEIVGFQKEIGTDIAAFDKAALDTFKTTKAKLAKDLALMKAAIKTAKAKLPKR